MHDLLRDRLPNLRRLFKTNLGGKAASMSMCRDKRRKAESMTDQEQQLLNGLIERVNGTHLQSKDAEAEQLLNSSLQRNPDSLYILCQTVLVQQFAIDKSQRDLQAARTEIDQLKQQSSKPQEHGSFLGNLFGLGKSGDTQQPASSAIAPQQYNNPPAPGGTPSYTPVQNRTNSPYGYNPQSAMQPGYGTYSQAPGYGSPTGSGMFGAGSSGGGGFLQGAMQTAAGVVAGEFAFRAIEDVFSGFGHGGGRGFEGGGEIVNNYYGEDQSGHGDGFGDRLQAADGFDSGVSPDIEDRRGESQGFVGSDGGDSGASSFADNSSDDASSFADNSGSYDDGSSFNSGGDDNSF